MKKIYLLVLFVFGFSAFAQQKGISYQAVIINPNAVAAPGYNGTSIPLANKAICLSFQIVNGANQVEYQESQAITTDGYGMVNVVIGTGTSGAGLVSTLEAVAWNQGNKKLVVGVNTDGVCSNYSEISNQVLNYTPYSFYAQNADIKDGYVTTAKLADGAVTDPKVAMGINPAKVGLGNVNNTSDANKPVSTATQNALNLKANLASPTFTGTVSGIDKAMVGLSNVDNTTDANKPVSTATQTALNLKANATDVTSSLDLKENVSNKSSDIYSDGSSTTKYPTVKAVKDYVDANASTGTGTIVDADATTKGKIKLAGDIAGTADLPTVPGLALKAPLASPSFTGTVTAPTYASTPISLAYSGTTINWNPVQGLNAAITLTQNSALSFTANPPVGSYGTIVLTQDGTGNRTITLPTIAGVTNQILGSTSTTSVTLSTAANAKDILNFYYDGTNCYWNIGQGYGAAAAATSSTANLATGVTGTLAVANGGTGATTATAALTSLGAAPLASPTFTGTVTTSAISTGALSATSVNTPIYASTPQALTDGSTISWNPALGLNASVALGGNRTLSFTTTPTAGSYGTLVVTQDATGGRTITLPSTANKVLGSTSTTTISLSSTANAKDILNFYYDGTNCYWNIGQGYGTAATSGSTNLASSVTGTLAVANGGTGATTKTTAFDALSPMTTSGDIIYGGSSGTGTRLAKGTDGQVLQLANGLPAWQDGFNKNTEKVAFGAQAGMTNQGIFTTAVGPYSGILNQGDNATALGRNAGNSNQGGGAVAIGLAAAEFSQGANAIAIGSRAGNTSQHANSIVLNATGSTLNTAIANSLYIAPIRNETAIGNLLVYNTSTKEITVAPNFAGGRVTASGGSTYNDFVGFSFNGGDWAKNTGMFNDAPDDGSSPLKFRIKGTTALEVSPSKVSVLPTTTSTSKTTGSLTVAGGLGVSGDLFATNMNASGTVTAGTVTYPNTHGTANQVLTTTGSGTLSWTTPASSGGTHTIGESYGGGIVFYTWDNGAHGLIGANTELNSGQAMTWGGGSNSYVGTTSSSGVLGGKMNTQRILNVIPVPTYGNGDPQTGQRSAAFYAATYLNPPVVVNGVTTTPQFSDWYLPNSYELTLFATQSAYFPNCNFATHDHWTSSERTDYAYLAYALGANSNTYIYQTNKSSTNYVVAIRSF